MQAKLQQARAIKMKEKEDFLVERRELLKMMEDIRHARVAVSEITYPGVTICINACIFKVLEAFRDVLYVYKGDKVVVEGN